MRVFTAPWGAPIIFLIAVTLPSPVQAYAENQAALPDMSCTGNVHAQVLRLWEHTLRSYFTKQIADSLNKDGNTLVLYNTQEYLQSFVEMTRRCKDRQQILELVDTLSPAFISLRPLPDAPTIRGWVCTDHHTCTPANHLLDKEVQLYSAQFLGLLGAVATDIVETISPNQQTAAEKAFVVNSAVTIATQVNHWLSPTYFKWVKARAVMTPADAKDGQSKYFFQDRDLWFMTSLSDLAELHQAGIKLNGTGAQALKSLQTKHDQVISIFNLFLSRITLINDHGSARAEIDRGYWRNYADSKYAAYSANVSPVLCRKNMFGLTQKTFRVKSEPSYIDPNLGWDFSHARRLVPALDTFTRNRANLAAVFYFHSTAFNPVRLQHALANQIVDKIWNKSEQYPLFSNFWDGSNGWYRSGYSSGIAGDCRPGQPPYSLAWSFPTGSYAQWGAFNGTIRTLTIRLYELFNSTDPTAVTFAHKYYRELGESNSKDKNNSRNHDLWMLTFLSSFVNL